MDRAPALVEHSCAGTVLVLPCKRGKWAIIDSFSTAYEILDILVSGIGETLGTTLLGIYLYGSLASGDFDPQVSDVDLLAILESDLTSEEAGALREMHARIAKENPAWDDRIEVAYLSRAALHTFRTLNGPLGIISPGEPFHVVQAGIEWLMNWYMVRELGITLFGPPPTEIIPEITKDEFVQATRAHAAEWREHVAKAITRHGQAYAILTLCRALHTKETGEQASKKQAAHWAAKQMLEWSALIENALKWRSAWREPDVDHAATYPETVRFVNYVVDRISG